MSTRTKILFTCVLSIMSCSVFADGCTVQGMHTGSGYFGETDCSNMTLSSLTVHGDLMLNNATINGVTDIFGNLSASNVTVSNNFSFHGNGTISNFTASNLVDIHGNVTLNNGTGQNTIIHGTSTIADTTFGNTTVYGTSNFSSSQINGDLTLGLGKAILNATTVNNINIVKTNSDKPEVLCLEKAHVKDNITFASGKGTIYLSGASKIDGTVTGAKQITGDCPA